MWSIPFWFHRKKFRLQIRSLSDSLYMLDTCECKKKTRHTNEKSCSLCRAAEQNKSLKRCMYIIQKEPIMNTAASMKKMMRHDLFLRMPLTWIFELFEVSKFHFYFCFFHNTVSSHSEQTSRQHHYQWSQLTNPIYASTRILTNFPIP